ncbi:hypothetical protein [Arthrobacter silvisoli]|uniref:hypothetical protein n=1 Tax=Arthrobacter silvisoli TaxID=2291022 RepID=UPI001FE31AB7|nr:hypothetical protein [Arthrobacter silvisoli]
MSSAPVQGRAVVIEDHDDIRGLLPVDISVRPARLVARVSAQNAREPFANDRRAELPDRGRRVRTRPGPYRGLGDDGDL